MVGLLFTSSHPDKRPGTQASENQDGVEEGPAPRAGLLDRRPPAPSGLRVRPAFAQTRTD